MRAPTTGQINANQGVLKFGLLAYLAAALSLIICYLKGFASYFGPTVGLAPFETTTGQIAVINPHLQAVLMWLFAALAVVALTFDRKKHGDNIPLLIGVVALIVIVGTLYVYYVGEILTFGYILLVLAAFLNHNRMLSYLNRKVHAQASELVELNDSLEQRVENQVEEIERLARLKRFLPGEVANLIISEGNESLLQSHRRYIACLFCDIRRFTSMTESMDPEDVIEVLHSFHESVGLLAVQYQGSIGYRAGDGVMVFFNDPIPCDDPDMRAVKLAFDSRDAFEDLCQQWVKLGVDVGLGMGIASGYATMGIIGVEGRFDYTPIGNAVNLAARLSDHAQDGEILISQRCWAEVEQLVASRPAGQITLKGFAQPVEAFFLEGPREDSPVVPLQGHKKSVEKQDSSSRTS